MVGFNTDFMEKVHADYSKFLKELLYKNRFFCEGEFTQKIQELSSLVGKEVETGTKLYRARIMSGITRAKGVSGDGIDILFQAGKFSNSPSGEEIHEALRELGIWGYNQKNSGMAPVEKSVEGRANPRFISYLYVARGKYTAVAESKPYMGENISIATYNVKIPLKIFDISTRRNCWEDATYADILNNFLSMKFSSPLRDGSKDYIATQYIAEYIKKLGFDGVCFSSSLHKGGKNITLYSDKKVEFEKSEVYEVKDIVIKTAPRAPRDAEDINIG